jgi:multiple sugar transport system permease protein
MLSRQSISNLAKINKTLISIILIFFALSFLFPFLWLVSTSLKPLDQTVLMPPVWLPRAYYIRHNEERVRVTFNEKNCIIDAHSFLVRITESSRKDEVILVDRKEVENGSIMIDEMGPGGLETIPVKVEIIREIPSGYYRVQEMLPYKNFDLEARIFYVPEEGIIQKIKFEFRNFVDVTRKIPFFRYLGNTLIVCILGVLGTLLSNGIVAYGFSKIKWKGRDTAFYVTIATMMIPFPVVMIPLFVLFKKLGMVGTLMPLWLPSFFGNAFYIFLLRQFFRSIPDSLIEAAKIDGCSEFQVFYRIILPLSRPIMTVVALFQFMYLWNDFIGPLIYLTDQRTFTLSLGLQFFQSQHGGTEWHHLMAASTLVILPIIVLFFFTQKTFIESITLTGNKG